MCGLNGIVALGSEGGKLAERVERMNVALAHRGPDDGGVFSDDRVSLGHRRLSIIDLSNAGHQPMQSADGRYVIVFNGEIYNFRELRSELDYPFRSHTDTEVLLAAWQTWGEKCIERLIGMFAFAVWDRMQGELHLVRDRLGKKPVYYYHGGGNLVFSSEMRAVLASGLVPRRLNADALVDFLRYQTVHQPDTIVEGIRLLPAGTHMKIKGREPEIRSYWTPLQARPQPGITRPAAMKAVRDALQKAVERRLVADVPFGAFLSGGIDSSAIVALMSQVTDKVSTFSISFAEEEFSEARYARMVAEKYNTDHHEIQLTPEHFLGLLPDALDHMDHPSGDGPNTYVVSKVTRDAGITMALSGLGGDELFAGYSIFERSMRLRNLDWLNVVPRSLRAVAGNVLYKMKPSIATAKVSGILGKPRLSALSAYPFNRQVYLDDQVLAILNRSRLPQNYADALLERLSMDARFRSLPLLSQVSVAEMATYMQHVLLRDTDQMSMAHALEVRVPFLDHELVELVLGLPDDIKYPHTPKQLLVESLGDLLPPEIVNRPKMGFTLPYERWMKEDLYDFCDERLNRLADRAEFDGSVVRSNWADFIEGKRTISWSRIWMLVVLEHWLEKNGVA